MGWLFSKLLARFALLVCTDAGDAPPVEVPPPQRSPAVQGLLELDIERAGTDAAPVHGAERRWLRPEATARAATSTQMRRRPAIPRSARFWRPIQARVALATIPTAGRRAI